MKVVKYVYGRTTHYYNFELNKTLCNKDEHFEGERDLDVIMSQYMNVVDCGSCLRVFNTGKYELLKYEELNTLLQKDVAEDEKEDKELERELWQSIFPPTLTDYNIQVLVEMEKRQCLKFREMPYKGGVMAQIKELEYKRLKEGEVEIYYSEYGSYKADMTIKKYLVFKINDEWFGTDDQYVKDFLVRGEEWIKQQLRNCSKLKKII